MNNLVMDCIYILGGRQATRFGYRILIECCAWNGAPPRAKNPDAAFSFSPNSAARSSVCICFVV